MNKNTYKNTVYVFFRNKVFFIVSMSAFVLEQITREN